MFPISIDPLPSSLRSARHNNNQITKQPKLAVSSVGSIMTRVVERQREGKLRDQNLCPPPIWQIDFVEVPGCKY